MYYSDWLLNHAEIKGKVMSSISVNRLETTTENNRTIGHIIITYIKEVCESMKNIYSRHGIQTHFNGENMLVATKDKDNFEKASHNMQVKV